MIAASPAALAGVAALLVLGIALAVFAVLPAVLQFAVHRLPFPPPKPAPGQQRAVPVFNDLTILGFTTSGVSVSVDMLVHLPVAIPLPAWFSAGLAAPPVLSVSRRRTRRHGGALQPLIQVVLSDPVDAFSHNVGGKVGAIAIRQRNIVVHILDMDITQKLIRKVYSQIKDEVPLDDVVIHVATKVSIQIMGFVLWLDVPLWKEFNVSPIIETAIKDKILLMNSAGETTTQTSSSLPPPVPPNNIPDFLGLDAYAPTREMTTLDSKEVVVGPLNLYKAGQKRMKETTPTVSLLPDRGTKSGLETLLPNPKVYRLPTTTTAQGSFRTGLRVAFSPHPPLLSLSIARVDFNVHLNREKVASGFVGPVKVGNGEQTTDILVEVLPDIVSGGATGVLKGALGGAKGFLRGVLAGAISGLTGGEFGDKSTVVLISGVNVYAPDLEGNVINVTWIRDILQAVDMEIEVNRE
ncbi:hypothetical protein HDU83_008372 [Entophlyctis luteolus]|nr:hypothetical protein HDU83_008372 [Entophlyctis luteolus]